MKFLDKFKRGKFLDKLRFQVISCPYCSQKLRVPLKGVPVLKITCSKCRAVFEIKFANPVTDLLKWDKSADLKTNALRVYDRFKDLPKRIKISLGLMTVSIAIVVVMVTSTLVFHVVLPFGKWAISHIYK